MGGTGSSAFPPIGRYLSGLCVAALGLCAAGWLALTPLAFGYRGRRWHDAALTDLATGGGLAAVCLITLTAWAVAWRRALRAEGVLRRPSRGQTRALRQRERDGGRADAALDPAKVLAALRALVTPLLDPAAEPSVAGAREPAASVVPEPRNAPEDSTVIQPTLAGTEWPMTGHEEEEW
jgi:hypothetical protein